MEPTEAIVFGLHCGDNSWWQIWCDCSRMPNMHARQLAYLGISTIDGKLVKL